MERGKLFERADQRRRLTENFQVSRIPLKKKNPFRNGTAGVVAYESRLGTSCIVARNLVNANLGTRYIQISLGGWDNHQNIYTPNAGIYPPARQLDAGLANLISDLATMPGANGCTRLDETLIVVKGEFGAGDFSRGLRELRGWARYHTVLPFI